MENLPVVFQKIVGDDTPMTSPPQDFGTHDGNSEMFPQFHEGFQSLVEFPSQCIISIIVKTLHMPECIALCANRFRARTSPPKLPNMTVANPIWRQFGYKA